MSTLLFVFLTCISFAQAIQYITIEPNAPTRSFFLTKNATQGSSVVYLKVDRRLYNQTEYFLRPTFSGCRGRYNMFVKHCVANCTDDRVRPPGPGNFDYIGIQTNWWTSAYQSLCFDRYSKCRNDKVFYIAIHTNLQELELDVSLETFPADQGGEFGVIAPTGLTYTDIYSNVLIKPVEYCNYVQSDGICLAKSSKVMKEAKYQIYYIVFPNPSIGSQELGNLGTVCGLKKYGTPYGEMVSNVVDKLSFYPDVPKGTKLYVGILYEVTIDGVVRQGTYRPFEDVWNGVYRRQTVFEFVYEQYKVIFWLLVSMLIVLIILTGTDLVHWYRNMRATGAPRFIFW
jgi:hypothetical protein